MNKTILATLALGAAALTSCVYDPYAGAPGGPPPYHQPGYGANAYNDGYRDGQHDNRNGRSYNPSRQYSYAPALREQYRAGYASGYRHSGGGYSGGDSAERNYAREGFHYGQQDRRNGLAYNPSRYFGRVPGYAREDFKRGYSRGWENWR